MQTDGYPRIPHHARHQIDVVLVRQSIDVRLVVPVRNGHRAAPIDSSTMSNTGQFSVGAADDNRLAAHDAAAAPSSGMHKDLRPFAEEVQLAVQLLALPARHHHQRRGRLPGGELIDEQRGRQPPAAHPRDVLVDPRGGQLSQPPPNPWPPPRRTSNARPPTARRARRRRNWWPDPQGCQGRIPSRRPSSGEHPPSSAGRRPVPRRRRGCTAQTRANSGCREW